MEDLELAIEDGIGRIVLDRPHVRNAITVQLVVDLRRALTELRDSNVRAVVLQGAQGTFCAGADLALVREALDVDPAQILAPLVGELHETIREMRRMPYPVVAALEGFAVGAGMGLALAADLRVVGRTARLVPGYFGIGASPDGGVSYFLTRALGGSRASSIILRNKPITADAMAETGLADEVVEDSVVVERATALAREVASVPPLALTRMRQLVDTATVHDLNTHLDAERQAVSELWPSKDFREGIEAFVERRSPQFSGV